MAESSQAGPSAGAGGGASPARGTGNKKALMDTFQAKRSGTLAKGQVQSLNAQLRAISRRPVIRADTDPTDDVIIYDYDPDDGVIIYDLELRR
jgi:hypothetical protein